VKEFWQKKLEVWTVYLVTVTLTVAVCENPVVSVPVIVRVYVPWAVVLATFIVMVAYEPAETDFLLNETVIPAGVPVWVNVTEAG